MRVTVCEFALPNENELAGNVLNPPVICHPDIHSPQPIQAGLESAPELDIVPSRRRWTVDDAQSPTEPPWAGKGVTVPERNKHEVHAEPVAVQDGTAHELGYLFGTERKSQVQWVHHIDGSEYVC